ncbi:MAG: hypothetical protein ACRC92_26830 [Peptostreptococcaceae bacterium]
MSRHIFGVLTESIDTLLDTKEFGNLFRNTVLYNRVLFNDEINSKERFEKFLNHTQEYLLERYFSDAISNIMVLRVSSKYDKFIGVLPKKYENAMSIAVQNICECIEGDDIDKIFIGHKHINLVCLLFPYLSNLKKYNNKYVDSIYKFTIDSISEYIGEKIKTSIIQNGIGEIVAEMMFEVKEDSGTAIYEGPASLLQDEAFMDLVKTYSIMLDEKDVVKAIEIISRDSDWAEDVGYIIGTVLSMCENDCEALSLIIDGVLPKLKSSFVMLSDEPSDELIIMIELIDAIQQGIKKHIPETT